MIPKVVLNHLKLASKIDHYIVVQLSTGNRVANKRDKRLVHLFPTGTNRIAILSLVEHLMNSGGAPESEDHTVQLVGQHGHVSAVPALLQVAFATVMV